MFHTYKNCKITVNEREFVADSLQLSMQADLQPVYLNEFRNSSEYAPGDGIKGSLSISYFMTGNDYLKTLFERDNHILTGKVGSLTFVSGYLQKYSLNCEPNQPAKTSVNILFFDDLSGNFTPTYEKRRPSNPLILSDVTYTDPTNGLNGSIDNIKSLSIDYEVNIEPSYLVGETRPNSVVFGEKSLTAFIDSDNISGGLPVSGNDAGIEINFKHPSNGSTVLETFRISGKVSERNVSVSSQDFVKSSYSIKQNYVSNLPLVTSFYNNIGQPGVVIIIYGQGFTTTRTVRFFGGASATVPAESFTIVNDGEIQVTVPSGAASGPLTITNDGGSYVTDPSGFTVSYFPINVTGFTPVTGYYGNSIKVTGSNFYSISNVYFGSADSVFSVLNNSTIQAFVPTGAKYDYITVLSSGRGISGQSPYKFVPVPIIWNFSPNTGISGNIITISGSGFNAVTGMTINNLPNPGTATFAVVSDNKITGAVPSGNTFGQIRLYGYSGVYARSLQYFQPIVQVTGLNPYSGLTGSPLEVLGQNFYPETMYPVDVAQTHFLVDVAGATGKFFRVNTTKLTGLVPNLAESGKVYVLNPNLSSYPSDSVFNIIYSTPYITGVMPLTGNVGDSISILGLNFQQTTGIRVSGLAFNSLVTSSIEVGALGDMLTFPAPNPSVAHRYNLFVETTHGQSGPYSGLFIRKAPTMTLLNPISGGQGALITMSGTNIYPNSRVYFNDSGTEASILTGSYNSEYTRLQFYVPTSATGYDQIMLYNGAGTAISGGLSFYYHKTPTISGFVPKSGAWNTTVRISGSGIESVTGMYLGTVPITNFSLVSYGSLDFVIPTGATSERVTIKSYGGSVSSTGYLIVYRQPILISGFTPTGIRTNRTLLITGSYLDGVEKVWFSGIDEGVTGFTVVGTTHLYVTVPRYALSGEIGLGGETGRIRSANPLNIIAPPIVNGLNRNYGTYGTEFSISGSGFTGMTFLFVAPTTGLSSGFVQAPSTIIGSTGATVTVPKNCLSGPIYASGDNEVFPTWSGTFYVLPTVTGFTPTGALTGSLITITGINAVDAYLYLFATGSYGGLGKPVSLLSGNHFNITGSHVLNTSTGYSIFSGMIGSEYGGLANLVLMPQSFTGITDTYSLLASEYFQYIPDAVSTNPFNFRQSPPTISGFSPVRGNTGTILTISGFNLRNVTGVWMGASPPTMTILTRTSGSAIEQMTVEMVYWIAGSGQIRVINPWGESASSSYFSYINVAGISGFTPTKTTIGNKVRITGADLSTVTGVYFGSYSSTFTYQLDGAVPTISGTVPDVLESLPRGMVIKLMNEAGSSQTGTFTALPSGATVKYSTPRSLMAAIPNTDGSLNFSHGLGFKPDYASITLYCAMPEYGYISGDEVALDETTNESVFGAEPFSISKDATNITLSHLFGSYNGIKIAHKSSGTLISGGITNTGWFLKATATYHYDF